MRTKSFAQAEKGESQTTLIKEVLFELCHHPSLLKLIPTLFQKTKINWPTLSECS